MIVLVDDVLGEPKAVGFAVGDMNVLRTDEGLEASDLALGDPAGASIQQHSRGGRRPGQPLWIAYIQAGLQQRRCGVHGEVENAKQDQCQKEALAREKSSVGRLRAAPGLGGATCVGWVSPAKPGMRYNHTQARHRGAGR